MKKVIISYKKQSQAKLFQGQLIQWFDNVIKFADVWLPLHPCPHPYPTSLLPASCLMVTKRLQLFFPGSMYPLDEEGLPFFCLFLRESKLHPQILPDTNLPSSLVFQYKVTCAFLAISDTYQDAFLIILNKIKILPCRKKGEMKMAVSQAMKSICYMILKTIKKKRQKHIFNSSVKILHFTFTCCFINVRMAIKLNNKGLTKCFLSNTCAQIIAQKRN